MKILLPIGCLGLVVAAALPRDGLAQTLDPQGPTALTQAALDTNTLQGGIGSGPLDPAPGGFGAGVLAPGGPGTLGPMGPGVLAPNPIDPVQEPGRPQTPSRAARELRGNPLWAIPLKSLTATRERPIFLPSRRPIAPPAVAGPPPAPAAAPPPPAAPEQPRLALVGAVVGESEGIAVFVDQNTQSVVRLRTGENHAGWILRSVRGREATLEKGQQTVQLALPAPTDAGAAPGLPGFPVLPGVPTGPRPVPGKEPEL